MNADPTGTLSLDQANLRYGETATFSSSVLNVPKHAETYVTVVCVQGETVVYQSSVPPFVLVDQEGQGLEWDGGAASGIARLSCRLEQGKKTTLWTLDEVSFDVAAA